VPSCPHAGTKKSAPNALSIDEKTAKARKTEKNRGQEKQGSETNFL
jgi:hypothetical protein